MLIAGSCNSFHLPMSGREVVFFSAALNPESGSRGILLFRQRLLGCGTDPTADRAGNGNALCLCKSGYH